MTYTVMHGSTKLKLRERTFLSNVLRYPARHHRCCKIPRLWAFAVLVKAGDKQNEYRALLRITITHKILFVSHRNTVLFRAKAKNLTLYSEITAVYCIKNTKLSNNERTNCTILTFKPDGIYIFFPVALRPHAGHGLLIFEVSRSHTTTHHSR